MTSIDLPLPQQNKTVASKQEMDTLRKLVLGDEFEQALTAFASEDELERVSRIITEAIKHRNQQDDTMAEAIAPILDSALHDVIQHHPEKITASMYPIIGPAIRKAVAAAFRDMMQTLNHVLENSVSFRAWLWRFQAWRIGMKYSEYVLLKTLSFKIDQVLLIHRETGILLNTVYAREPETENPELVSAMLTAINDFVSDSFRSQRASVVECIQVGDFNLEIDAGPEAILAAVVRGSQLNRARDIINPILERIHAVFGQKLLHFDGNVAEFESTRELLKSCLVEKYLHEEKKSTPWIAWSVVLAVCVMVGWKGFEYYQIDQQYREILSSLKREPGYVVLTHEKHFPELHVELLRSPFSVKPDRWLDAQDLGKWESVVFRTHLSPLELKTYIENYFPSLIASESNIRFTAEKDTLFVVGQMSSEQYDQLKQDPLLRAVYDQIDLSGVEKSLESSIKAKLLNEWLSIKARMDAVQFKFQSKSTSLEAGETEKLSTLVEDIQRLSELADKIPISRWQVYLTGHADHSGGVGANMEISQQRAKLIQSILMENKVPEKFMLSWGVGNVKGSNLSEKDQRMVSVQLFYAE